MGNSALNSSLRHLKVSAKELDSKHDSIYQGAITVHSLTVLSKQQWPAEISRYYCGTILGSHIAYSVVSSSYYRMFFLVFKAKHCVLSARCPDICI